jgi:pilus assembly protein TadC
MTFSLVVAASFAAMAAAIGQPPVRFRLGRRETDKPRAVAAWLLPVGSGLAVVALVGGWFGFIAGIAVGIGVHRYLAGRPSEEERSRASRRALELPVAIDLLAACLAVGASQQAALATVADGLDGSLGADLHRVATAMLVGASADEAWSLVSEADLQAVAGLLRRAERTGAPVTPLLGMLAEQRRQQARGVAMDAARALGVRSTGPLGLCFLPAFVLIAVVPLVVSLLPVAS